METLDAIGLPKCHQRLLPSAGEAQRGVMAQADLGAVLPLHHEPGLAVRAYTNAESGRTIERDGNMRWYVYLCCGKLSFCLPLSYTREINDLRL